MKGLHRRRWLLGAIGPVLAAGWLGGCASGPTSAVHRTGSVTVTIHWPPPTARLLPQNAMSVDLILSSASASYARTTTTYNNPGGFSVSTNPSTPNSATTVADLTGLPHAIDYQLVANAYSAVGGALGSGTLVAAATVTGIAVTAGAATAQVVTLGTTVTSVVVALTAASSTGTTLAQITTSYDATAAATLTAYDRAGGVVPIAPGTVSWTSSNTAAATVSGGPGNPGVLTIPTVTSQQTTTITGTYAEAGPTGLVGGTAGTPGDSSASLSSTATLTIIHLGPAPLHLGAAGAFCVLAGTAVTNTDADPAHTTIDGLVGVFPGTSVTGLPNGAVTTGQLHPGDTTAQAAEAALSAAYDSAVALSANVLSLPADVGGQSLAPGLYQTSGSSGIAGTGLSGILTLDAQGDPGAVWVFQIGTSLITSPGSSLVLVGHAQAGNIFWQVGSSVTLGTDSSFRGNLLANVSITLDHGASLQGRALARTGAVTLDTNAITLP